MHSRLECSSRTVFAIMTPLNVCQKEKKSIFTPDNRKMVVPLQAKGVTYSQTDRSNCKSGVRGFLEAISCLSLAVMDIPHNLFTLKSCKTLRHILFSSLQFSLLSSYKTFLTTEENIMHLISFYCEKSKL